MGMRAANGGPGITRVLGIGALTQQPPRPLHAPRENSGMTGARRGKPGPGPHADRVTGSRNGSGFGQKAQMHVFVTHFARSGHLWDVRLAPLSVFPLVGAFFPLPLEVP